MTEIEKEYYRRLALQEEYGGTNKPVNKITPLVSVVTTTYQHAPYIRQCLDSILMQETDFPFELIIGEDGSTDGTREICIEYANKYPDKIRLFLRDRKLTQYVTEDGRTVIFNGYFSRAAARGEYIAMCEGDDYWIDPNKLKKQIKILQASPFAAACCTDFIELFNNNRFRYHIINNQIELINARKIIISDCIGTLTVVAEKSSLPSILPEQLARLWDGDWSHWLLIALKKKKIIKIPDITAVYRDHSSGLSKMVSIQRIEDDGLKFYNYVKSNTNGEYKYAIRTGLSMLYIKLSKKYLNISNTLDAYRCLRESVNYRVSRDTILSQLEIVIKLILKHCKFMN